MIGLVIVLILVLGLLCTSVYLLGFKLGGTHWESELTRVRNQSAVAERQLHDLTRQAFVAIAEEAERRGRS